MAEALNLPIKMVTGYKGTAEIRLACESGELDGTVRTMDSMRADWKKAWEAGDVIVVLQATSKPIPDLPGVPLAVQLAKTPEARTLIEVGIQHPSNYMRPYVLPPGTPKDRVQIIRNAFIAALEDKELRAEAEKSRLSIDYLSGDELQKLVSGLFNQDAALLAKLKDIIYR